METLCNKIISEFNKLDTFKYTDINTNKANRNHVEEQVVEELKYHCKGNQFTNYIKNQLVDIYSIGYVEICGLRHPYEPHDIYLAIETVVDNHKIHKPFKRKTSLLRGKNVFHIHHSQSFYSMCNCIRYFKSKYKCDNDVWHRLNELRIELAGKIDLFTVLANEVFIESLSMQNKTGEWLVFSKENGKIKFLCLYIHDMDPEDSGLYSLVKNEL